jgi:hypothetical protein
MVTLESVHPRASIHQSICLLLIHEKEYSLTDGIHPWGSKGVLFLGGLLYAWWTKLDRTAHQDTTLEFDGKLTVHAHSYDHLAFSPSSSSSTEPEQLQRNQSTHNELLAQLLPPLYVADPIGLCTRCDALAGASYRM